MRYEDNIAAIVLEPYRGIEPSEEFLNSLKTLQKKYSIPLILDEISAGFRLRWGGSHLGFDYAPDIAVFSKALGNGYPIGAIIGKEDIMNAAETTFISSTYWTERIGPSAALATIAKFKEMNVAEHLISLGKRVQKHWSELAGSHGLEIAIHGFYPISHFSFKHSEAQSLKALFIQLMLEEGILASTLFYAMYAHTHDDLDRYFEAVDRSFSKIKKILVDTDNLEIVLKGKPTNTGLKRLNQ